MRRRYGYGSLCIRWAGRSRVNSFTHERCEIASFDAGVGGRPREKGGSRSTAPAGWGAWEGVPGGWVEGVPSAAVVGLDRV